MLPSRSLCPSSYREPRAPPGAVHAVGSLGRAAWKRGEQSSLFSLFPGNRRLPMGASHHRPVTCFPRLPVLGVQVHHFCLSWPPAGGTVSAVPRAGAAPSIAPPQPVGREEASLGS